MREDDRDLLLARIRAALGGTTAAAATTPPVASPAAADDLLDAFVRASADVQAPVSVVGSWDDARRRVREILEEEGVTHAIVSPEAGARPWAIAGMGSVRLTSRAAAAPDREALLTAGAGITVAAFGLADSGTLAFRSAAGDHRLDSLVPPLHVALLDAACLLPGLHHFCARAAAERLFERHSAVVFVRGPSRTADIELTLTVGVHGPGKVRVVAVKEERNRGN